ncbi:transcriptional regulator [Pseudonocardia benzenivorans]|uniref:MarR family transcriptional regulator n=2 Tax=Pseudonocardia TaxID=1847 RepID=F4CKC8_PSEUX|nr:MarR family transcriptional regulator [Pseudonocardia dioxanivorans CB1190]GJF02266.1 MarR family transcriptional regulator [Pseudonocardia sp. D17]
MTAMPELDPVIHAQARLRVTASLASLCAGDKITFPRLQELLDMTAGNLSTHLRKLEDAGYVEITKAHQRRTPVTYVELTHRGRRAFEDYTAALRALLDPATAAAVAPREADDPDRSTAP